MKQLNPSLQFADEDGGALKSPEMRIGDNGLLQDDQKNEQHDFNKNPNMLGKDLDRQVQSEITPDQLKPEVF